MTRSALFLVWALPWLFLAERLPSAAGADPGTFQPFSWDQGPLRWQSPLEPDHHVESLGLAAGFWGTLASGCEAWAYPFKMFGGLEFQVSTNGGESFQSMTPLARTHVAAPHFAQLHFAAAEGNWSAKVSVFVPRELPAVLMVGEWDGRIDLVWRVQFRPSLAPMHWEVGGELTAAWEPEPGRLTIREAHRDLTLTLWTGGEASVDRNVDGSEQALEYWIPGGRGTLVQVPLAVALSWPGSAPARETAALLWREAPRLFREAQVYYEQLLSQGPRVTSPEPEVNEAMAWSLVSLDQLRIRNPFLGYGLVSGYSSSGTGTRPRYCWFFEEPTLTSWAYHRVGLSGQVAEALRFLQRWQREDGKTVHEVVQSLPFYTNYFEVFPYAYMHTDGPVYYLAAYSHYYRSTGHTRFIREEWLRIKQALAWCFTMMDPKDGLLRIGEGEWGTSESSLGVWKDTQLEFMWVRALDGMVELAGLMGDEPLANRCAEVARRALRAVENQFWDEQEGAYFWGLDRQGQPLSSWVPHHAVGFWLSRPNPERVRRTLRRMASADFRTDWGVRSLALSDPRYDPGDYQSGSVWPVWNAGVMVSDYRHGRAVEGYRNWRAMLALRRLQGLGPMPEVLSGRTCQRLPEGVPHQMFSELAPVNGFYDGMLGLEVDVPHQRLVLAPRIPPHWDHLVVEQVPVGPHQLSLEFRQDPVAWSCRIQNVTVEDHELTLRPELPAGSRVTRVEVDDQPWSFRLQTTPHGVIPELSVPRIKSGCRIRIHHHSGVAWLPVDPPLHAGVVNRNLRVLEADWQDRTYQFTLEGRPGRSYPVRFFADAGHVPQRTIQAVLREKLADGFLLEFQAPDQAPTNRAGFVRWEVSVQF